MNVVVTIGVSKHSLSTCNTVFFPTSNSSSHHLERKKNEWGDSLKDDVSLTNNTSVPRIAIHLRGMLDMLELC